jgi:serine/threonine protein phosphatase PrpC
MNAGELAIDDLLTRAHLASDFELPDLFRGHALMLGATEAIAYLADLQQTVLLPFLPAGGPGLNEKVESLGVDSTVAGRCFQHQTPLLHEVPGGETRFWIPLLDGTERLGAMAITLPDAGMLEGDDGLLRARLIRFASIAAELIVTKTAYGDTVVRLRRTAEMGLAAEIQWSVLPPLMFACDTVTVAAALEPAYEVAGDSVDYAVDAGMARIAVFDGMGHGLQSSQLAVVAISAYRNARRRGASLLEVVRGIDAAVTAVFGGEAFTTALVADLDTDTGMLTWVNAGHPPPLLLREGKLVKELETEPVLPFGLAEGLVANADIPVGRQQLEPGDLLLFFTDGVTEARSPTGELYGVERLTDLVRRNLAASMPPPETMRRVVRDLLDYQQGQLSDDATLLALEWRTGGKEKLLPNTGGPED